MMKPSRRSRGSATIQDVARAAGVSAMTVSRVVNGVKNVREDTRKAVLEAVKNLNYSPNSAARMLAAGEATQIGLLYANPSAAYLSRFLVGAMDGARRAGCQLVIEAASSTGSEEDAEATRRFTVAHVEGVILPPPLSQSRAVIAELLEADTPFVTVGGSPHGGLNVRIDDFAAAAALTDHLLDLGHRDIGFICGDPNQDSSHDRLRGFRDALARRGLDAGNARIEHGDFTYRTGIEAAKRLLSDEKRPSAIFASNDDMAAAAVNVAHRHGLSVPDDISVVGFDDTAPATTIWPELTTMRQPIEAMAEAALDLLLTHLRNYRSVEDGGAIDRILPHELVVRQSTGPCRSARTSRAKGARVIA